MRILRSIVSLRSLRGASALGASLFVVLASSALVAGCKGNTGSGAPMGRACSPRSPCPVDYACVFSFDGSTLCMAGCTINATVCEDHSACLPLQPGPTHACYVGGEVAIGDECTTVLDCVHSGVCLATGPGIGRCVVGCNLDGTVGCEDGLTCVATTDGNNGYCSTGP